MSETARTNIQSVAREHGVTNLRVFGSTARGTRVATSDLDLLVVFPAGATLWDVIGFKQDLEDKLGMPVDVVEEKGLPASVLDRILNEAVAL